MFVVVAAAGVVVVVVLNFQAAERFVARYLTVVVLLEFGSPSINVF